MSLAYRRSASRASSGSSDGAAIVATSENNEEDRPGQQQALPATISPDGSAGYQPGVARNRVPEAAVPQTDAVTGLLSYHAFVAALEQSVTDAARRSRSCALLFLDITDFRLLNDVHGLPFGDQALRAVAGVLTEFGEATGERRIGRLGSDEFGVLLPGASPPEAGAHAARIEAATARLSLRAPTGERLPIAVQFGVAVYPDDARSPAALYREAEERARRRAPIALLEDRAALRAEMERTVVGFPLLDALVSAVDAKDAYTRRHSEDVLRYVICMARELDLPITDQRALMVAALMHDIGKIALPERILRRPDRLKPEDFEAVKAHPSVSASLLDTLGAAFACPEEMEKTRLAVRYHHERWDGTGYPSGLAGENIPLGARLLAVADAYSAMTLDRPYRKALTFEEAAVRLQDGSGVQWDAACVAVLLRALNSP